MSKKKIRVYISCCISCRKSDVTLYSLTKEVMICKNCRAKLYTNGEVDAFDCKGKLTLVKENDKLIVRYVPKEEEGQDEQ